jgi:hypothetical protein
MKKIKFFLIIVLPIIINSVAEAQLLKKLKNKFDNTINGKSNNNTTSKNNNTDNQFGSNSSSSSNVFGDTTDFAKMQIQTIPTVSLGDMKGSKHIFHVGYCSYDIINNAIVPKVIVTSGNQPEEAAGYDGVTYIFENGKLSLQNVDLGSQGASLIEEHDKWNWPYSATANNDKEQLLQYSVGATGQQAYISFNGKKFGPYNAVTGIAINKSRTKFFAIVSYMGKEDVSYYLISSEGEKVKLPGLGQLMTDVAFSKAAAFGFSHSDYDSKNTETTVQEIQNDLHNSDIYFSDGTVIKNATNIAAAGNAWLSPAGKNFLSADPNIGAFINGKKVLDKGKGVSAGKLWCDASGARWCYLNSNGSIVFNDGTEIKNVDNPQQLPLNGKTYLVWFQIIYKKDKDLGGYIFSDFIFCKREF